MKIEAKKAIEPGATCSFCEREGHETKRLFQSPGPGVVTICDWCVAQCNAIAPSGQVLTDDDVAFIQDSGDRARSETRKWQQACESLQATTELLEQQLREARQATDRATREQTGVAAANKLGELQGEKHMLLAKLEQAEKLFETRRTAWATAADRARKLEEERSKSVQKLLTELAKQFDLPSCDECGAPEWW